MSPGLAMELPMVNGGTQPRPDFRWRVTFIDAVSARRIDVDVDAPDVDVARDRAWATLRATRPAGLVVVELLEARPAEDIIGPCAPEEDEDERDQGLHPPG
jgi:hypothetical protein